MKAMHLLLAVSILLASLLLAMPVHAQDQVIHVVQPGQNLFRIALQYGTTVDAIMAANGLTNARLVYSGQRLVIPSGSGAGNEPAPSAPATGGTYTVQRGDTLSRIALRHGVTVWALAQTNGISVYQTIYVGQRLAIPGGSTPAPSTPALGDTYTVRPGDTLSQIARRFGTTVSALARLNGIANPSAIYPGQVLRMTGAAPVPSSGGAKRIIMDLSEQHLYAYQGDQLVYSFVASSGAAPSTTRAGEFHVQSKIPNAYGSAWNIWMPNWLGIYWSGSIENGIHALPILSNGQRLWAGYLGRPISYGCIVLGVHEAELLYNWADIGTLVTVRY